MAVGAFFLLSPAGSIRATCGSANCFLITGTEQGVGLQGRFTIDLSFRSLVQDRKLSASGEVDEVLTPKVDFENGVLEPNHHREIRTQNTLVEVDMAYGLTDKLTLAWALPVINERDHEHFNEVGTVDEQFTREDGASGFGDVRVGVRYGLMIGNRDLLVGGLLVKLPTGEYRLHDSEGAINEPSIQPGTGSTDFIGTLSYSRQVVPAKYEWFVSGSYRLNRENSLDYRFGDEALGSVGFRGRTGKAVTWSLQANGRWAGRDTFLGSGVPSTGSTFVNLTPGVRFDTDTGTSIYGFIQVPVYQKVNEVALAPGAALLLGISHLY